MCAGTVSQTAVISSLLLRAAVMWLVEMRPHPMSAYFIEVISFPVGQNVAGCAGPGRCCGVFFTAFRRYLDVVVSGNGKICYNLWKRRGIW